MPETATKLPVKVHELKAAMQLTSARFSPCGRLLYGAGIDGLLHRWDASLPSLPELPSLKGHGGWIQEIAFAAQAPNRCFVVDSWGQLICWPVSGDEVSPLWSQARAHGAWIQGIAASADGKFVATCGWDRAVRIWSGETGELRHEFTGHATDWMRVAIDPQGSQLVAGDFHGQLQQWSLADGQPQRTFDGSVLFKDYRLQEIGGIRALAFSPDGKLLLAGGMSQDAPTVLVWDWTSGALQQTIACGKAGDVTIADLQFDPQGQLYVITNGNPGQGKLQLRNLTAADPLLEDTSMFNVHSVSLHPAGRRLVVVATNNGSNGNGKTPGQPYLPNYSPLFVWEWPVG